MKMIPVFVAAGTMLLLFGVLTPTQAYAHAGYKSSTPSPGERLADGPAQVEITFTQDIQKLGGTYGIEVVKDRGLDVTAGPAVMDDGDRTKLSVPLQPNLLDGRYVVNWKNVSDEDGDPREGAFSFYVGDYEPNTVDLANDAQLERIGAEEDETPSNEEPPSATSETPASTAPAAKTAAATAPIPSTPGDTDNTAGDDSSNTTLIIIVAGVAAVIAVAAGGFFVTRRGS
jgi:methionine-rich copper-binding protein CopC